MRRLVYLAAAERDLISILDYVTRESGSAAIGLAFTKRLQARCARLAALPGTLGRARPELWPDLRSFPVGNYVIFFRYRDDVLEVVNVLEGHRDIDAFFSGSAPPEAEASR
ncbi:type II toxin-antitoxin system RelE/ParE family toxin [Amaricoccus sp.]|uniref:type II toxin-antitoxin system RelE/ParE family toxin n=1 Tax=Amaricoccus sp. TaxID=1872485 RepID=UPI001B6ED9C4|nr:type II toxin-antitoxin system RelE/ParE family toxin [Amaricoccus sp.]MBP7000569.1 type II toxin-antitoxin system RelE/ParE family toxin [Amaricoccus sp.]